MPIAVELEIAPDGSCLAHAPPTGCAVRGANQDEVLEAVPAAVARHRAWLRDHGVTVGPAPDGSSAVDVIETQRGWAPLRQGDRAALFRSDTSPLDRPLLDRLLALCAFARQDLLAAIRDLPAAVLARPTADGSSIGDIARHVGNAAEWYVSRLVPPETLPPEWADDAALPLAPFLEMELRTASDRLRRLTDHELAAVVTPTAWTAHPDEPWTARKALRRRLEHELEHLDQIRTILAAWRVGALPTTDIP
jgi:hypothetical protein